MKRLPCFFSIFALLSTPGVCLSEAHAEEAEATEGDEAADDERSRRSRRPRSQSLLTLAVGAEGGYGRYQPSQGEPAGGFVAELTARLRLFRILGVQFSYNLMGAVDTGDLVMSSKFRLTGVLYLLPHRRISIYVLGGVGARDIREVISVTAPTNSYHLGVGIEVYLGRRLAISAEYCWVIPGYASMQRSVQNDTDEAVPDIEDLPEGEGTTVLGYSVPRINVMDFFDAGNFQITVGLRFYI